MKADGLEGRKEGSEEPHHVDDHPSEWLPLLLSEVLEDVAIVLLEKFKAHG